MKITIKKSKIGRVNPQFWNRNQMFTGDYYDIYIGEHHVHSELVENNSEYITYGEDFENKDVEIFEYKTISEYMASGWFFEEKAKIDNYFNEDGTIDEEWLEGNIGFTKPYDYILMK